MRLTIEIGNPSEIEQLLQIFSTLNLESIHVVLDDKGHYAKEVLRKLNRPIKKRLDIEILKKEKNYKGVNRERFDQLVKEINITEPIELLMSQLSQ
jgi:hypothetical protein